MTAARKMAVIGLGAMGAAMAHRLLDSGFDLVVFNRSAALADPLVRAGARCAPTAALAASGQEVVLLSLSDEYAVEDVLVGQGVLDAMPADSTIVDTSAVGAAFARRMHERVAAAGVRRVESAVVGNPLQARSGELRVFTAGDRADVARVDAVLSALGSTRLHLGDAGSAAAVKLVFNLVLAAQVAGLAEAVCVASAAGLDRTMVLSAIAQSGFSSPVLRFRADLMRERRYEPASFRTRLMAKDLRLALETDGAGAGRYRVLEAARSLFQEAADSGLADQDAAAVIEQVERTAATRVLHKCDAKLPGGVG